MSQEENGQHAQNVGGPAPSGIASNQVALAPYRHCLTCTCGQQHYYPYYTPYDPYHWPWITPWIVYTNL